MAQDDITVFHDCTIITMDKDSTVASAMAIHDGKVVHAGTNEAVSTAIESLATGISAATGHHPCIVRRDLHGACIVPGFIDTHMHPGFYVYSRTQLDLSKARSHDDLARLIQEDERQRGNDEWILGMDLMEDLFDDENERFFPTRVELDKACQNKPVVVIRHDGHICSVNSMALRLMGISKNNVPTSSDRKGEIRVGKDGEPTGVFTEAATQYPLDHVTIPDMARLTEAGKRFTNEIASFGVTTIGAVIQLGAEGIAGQAGAMELPLMELLIKDEIFKQDFVFYLVTDKPKQLARVQKKLEKMSGGTGRYSVGGLKAYSDGSFGARTAAMFEPYADSPEGQSGFMIKEKHAFVALFRETHELGFQVAVHAIGDKANRTMADVFKEVLARDQKPHRHRIEHASTLTPDTLADMATLGIILACQPAFINSEHTWLEKRLGPERLKLTYPFKSIMKAGVILAGASDAPVESARVLDAIQACVTRKGIVPEEALNVVDALKMFTINAAHAIGQETVKGSLEAGKQADFVVLDRDIRATPLDQIASIQVLRTYHRGHEVFPFP